MISSIILCQQLVASVLIQIDTLNGYFSKRFCLYSFTVHVCVRVYVMSCLGGGARHTPPLTVIILHFIRTPISRSRHTSTHTHTLIYPLTRSRQINFSVSDLNCEGVESLIFKWQTLGKK